MIKTYYLLTKPGIIFGNLVTTASAFILASRGHFDFLLFLATMAGLGCVIASACVCNNYIDRESDQKMARTKNRALVTGLITGKKAIAFAVFLGLGGIFILAVYTHLLAVSIALVGFFVYVAMYSFWKHRSSYATLVGSISGAVPPVVGYCAASDRFDAGALIFFLILVLWQMPHFFAIAMYRSADYNAASIPVLPVKKGNLITKIHMLLYIMAFIIATFMLVVFGYTGYIYLAAATLLGLFWLFLCIKGFTCTSDKLWARKMFIVSLVVVMGLCIAIPFSITS